ncbi:ALLENE OXIDE SYNTHASE CHLOROPLASTIC [Salix purpurea]|uniref:ALLENE OXIDE SYNTHASE CHLOROPLASTIC n=1 Tax=Salix purpurea TaxID=77065 RepID=A0A9Q0SQR0_SALPP|nr:ALLENE OXIDE SYNTHASE CHLOROPLASTIC [Salix purpurea]
MASSSLALSSLQTQLQSLKKPSSPKPSPRRFSVRPIRASISKKPSVPAPPVNVSPSEPTKLPILKIPGDYGLPLIGPFKDRMDYFYNQGRDESWFYLTEKAFPVLFDVTKVEKKDLFTGTFMPSTELTGGYRVLSYLDPSEPKHAKLKQLMFYLLKSRRDHVIPEFNAGYTELFMSLEKNLALRGKASFGEANDQAAFNFLARCWFGTDPAETTLGLDGPGLVSKWVLFNLGPVLKLGLPKYLEDLTIHTFRLPPLLIKKSYQRLYDFFYASSGLPAR